jgi:hypothetical protein
MGKRLSFTKAPDPHAEQLNRIYNIMRADIEKTRQLISSLIRDLSDGRLEDVVATTHLLKSLKKVRERNRERQRDRGEGQSYEEKDSKRKNREKRREGHRRLNREI